MQNSIKEDCPDSGELKSFRYRKYITTYLNKNFKDRSVCVHRCVRWTKQESNYVAKQNTKCSLCMSTTMTSFKLDLNSLQWLFGCVKDFKNLIYLLVKAGNYSINLIFITFNNQFYLRQTRSKISTNIPSVHLMSARYNELYSDIYTDTMFYRNVTLLGSLLEITNRLPVYS